jgi:aryl-alcohol dehydrogenase
MNGLKPPPGSSVAVLGAGAAGLAAVLGASVCGCATVISVDRVESRLEAAKCLGATHVINTEHEPDVARAVLAIAARGVNYIVESAGVLALIIFSLGGLAIRGTLGLVAVPPRPPIARWRCRGRAFRLGVNGWRASSRAIRSPTSSSRK